MLAPPLDVVPPLDAPDVLPLLEVVVPPLEPPLLVEDVPAGAVDASLPQLVIVSAMNPAALAMARNTR